MAILQISRITQRKGLLQDLPAPLAGAELGWAVDTRQLFIGNGELAEGAPVVGNTEVLTEFSDILNYANQYTYEGLAAGYTVQTGATSGAPVTQSLQSRLDSIVIVTDFGATGDGVTDDTAAINRALFQLYCREVNPQIRRGLYFPAGTYVVTDTILVPPYAKLYGDGTNSSIISFQVNAWAASTAYAVGVLVSYNGSYYRSINAVPASATIPPSSDTTNWEEELGGLPEYVVQTADSLQQTGTSIGTNGAARPQSIEITDMSLSTSMSGNDSALSHNILLIDRATQVSINNVTLQGPFTTNDGDTSADDLSCVNFASSGSYPCSQIVFDTCKFAGATYGFNTDQVIKSLTVSNSEFNALYQGVLLDTNPAGVRIVHNFFDNVYHEGIVFNACNLNASSYNIFYDVGNQYQGEPLTTGTSTAVISISGDSNISVGDLFERTTSQSAVKPRIDLNDTSSIVLGQNIRNIAYTINGTAVDTVANELQLGEYARTAGIKSVLNDNDTGTLYVVDAGAALGPIYSFKMDYSITRGTTYRTGTLTVVSGTTFSYTDDYTENASTGITLSAAEATSQVTVSYTSTSTGDDANIYYSITHLG